MNKYLLILFAAFTLVSCNNDEEQIAKIETEADIIAYISDNNIDAKRTNSGLYYSIETEGTGARPNSTSSVTVKYKGQLLNGNVFDENKNGATFGLNQVIPGWTEGIQLFKEGGKGKLIIPYQLGYGIQGSRSIPGGAVLVFDVELVSVN